MVGDVQMTVARLRRWAAHLGALAVLSAAIAGCSHAPNVDAKMHFSSFNVPAPKGSTVYVCHAYGCRVKTKVRFGPEQLKEITALMKKMRRDDSPKEERRAVAYAIGWMETYVGKIIGTSADRPGMDFTASGDPTQQDCVDEATNTTSYLSVLQNNHLLKYHTVSAPIAKENYFRGIAGWTHWTAVLTETDNHKRWAVDSWIYKNGENPAIVETNKWYIAGLDALPKGTK